MSRIEANRLLSETKLGLANPSETEILFALMATGDLEIQPFHKEEEPA